MKAKTQLVIITAVLVLMTCIYVPLANSVLIPVIDPGTHKEEANENPCVGVSGYYTTTGNNLTVFVCTAATFNAWNESPSGAPPAALWAKVNSTSGNFDLSWPDAGTYYVVFSNMEGTATVFFTFVIVWKPKGIPGFELIFVFIGLLGLLIAYNVAKKNVKFSDL